MRKKLAAVAVLGAVSAFGSAVALAAGPYIPFHGAYRLNTQPAGLAAFTYVDETAGRVNFTLVDETELDNAGLMQRFVQNNVWFTVYFQPTPENLENKISGKFPSGEFVGRLAQVKAKLHANGAISRLVGISLGEELFSQTFGNPNFYRAGCTAQAPSIENCLYPSLAPTAGDTVAHGNALRDLLFARINNVEAAFPAGLYPNVHTIQVEHLWNDWPGVAPYAPPPANLDVLGLDPYLADPFLSDCSPTNKAEFDGMYGPRGRVYWATLRFSQPILLVGQSFKHGQAAPGHAVMPAPCQMDWWYQLAADYASRVPALLWFAYGWDDTYNTPGGNAVMGVRHPEHLDRWLKMIEIFDRNLANRP